MLKKRITASVLALILCLSGITNILAENTDSASDRLIIGDYISEPITKFAFNPASSSLKEVEPADGECEKRAADKVLKFYWGANKNPTGYLLGNNSKAMYGDVSGYNYINMWVYCDAGNESTSKLVDLIVKTGADENKKDKAFRYRLDLSKWKDGWNLISLDMKSPTENIRNAEWSGGIWNLNLAVGNYGAAKWTQDGAVYLEKMWFSKSLPAAEFRAYPSIENEAGYVPADLGGDRTFVFNMSSSALPNDAENQIEVYKGNDRLSDGYSVSAEGSELKVIFNENLEKGFEYTIKLLKENEGRLFVDLDGNILKEGKEVSFMVEAPSKTFKITSSDPQDGETDVDADLKTGGGKTNTVTISTNNPIETVQDINNIVRVYKSGALIKDGYTALYSASQENQIEVVFDGALESGTEYSISLNNLTDIAGTKLSGKNKISFTTVQKAELPDVELAKFDQDDSIETYLLDSSTKMIRITDENSRLSGGKSMRFDIAKGVGRTIIGKPYTINNAEQYKYMNMWMYSPSVSSNSLNVMLTDGDKKYYRATTKIDWVGWRLISVSIQGMTPNNDMRSDDIKALKINANDWSLPWDRDGFVQIERVWLTAEKPTADMLLSGTSLPDGAADCPISDMKIGLIYNYQVDAFDTEKISVRSGGGSEIGFAAENSGNCLWIKPSKLKYGGRYTVTLGSGAVSRASGETNSVENVYTFSTVKSGLSAGITELTEESEECTAKVSVSNSGTAAAAQLHLAFYDENGVMLREDIKEEVSAAEAELSISVSKPENTALIKGFVTDKNGNLLYNGYSVIGTEYNSGQRVYPSGKIDYSGISLDVSAKNSLVQIKGTVEGGINCVLLTMTDESGKTILNAPVEAGADGEFIYSLDMEGYKSGCYKIKAVGYAKAAETSEEFSYLDADGRDDLLKIINNEDAGKAAQALKNNGAALGLSGLSDIRIKGIADSIKRFVPYNDFSGFEEKVKEIVGLINEMNSLKWTDVSEFLSSNNDMLLTDDNAKAAYKSYCTYDEKVCNIINKDFIKSLPLDSFEEFGKMLSQSVDRYKKGELTKSDGGASGGSSGGGSGKSNSISVSPGGSYSQNVTAPDSNEIFKDLASSEWARESILKLYNKGIISPDADKLFRPEDSITREELVKLIISAVYTADKDGICTFTDAEENAWYVPYLAAAHKIGIVQGNPDGSFGIGQPITREDIAVMVYRALKNQNNENTDYDINAEFDDDGDISDYAKEAVYSMKELGILSGMGDGTFMPKEKATRAQAAKIISSVVDKLS